MPLARKSQVSLEDTNYYHCISRCVRRAFLWGNDKFSGKDYSHRKQWVVDRLKQLSGVFTIEICAYAVMSNHYHVVLCVNKRQALSLSDNEVMYRWNKLFSLPELVKRYKDGLCTDKAEIDKVKSIVAMWRDRLYDISWYMRCLNEHLARKANAEDQCTGRFWEGRFKSQALLDEAGLLTCMAYVDLNPVRARIASTPEESDYTSIQERISVVKKDESTMQLKEFHLPERQNDDRALPFSYNDYLELVDWSGRAIRADKRGYIAEDVPPIMARLNIEPDQWKDFMRPDGNIFNKVIGSVDAMRLHAEIIGQRWCKGMRSSSLLFST